MMLFNGAAERLFGYAAGRGPGPQCLHADARALSRRSMTAISAAISRPARRASSASAARSRRCARMARPFPCICPWARAGWAKPHFPGHHPRSDRAQAHASRRFRRFRTSFCTPCGSTAMGQLTSALAHELNQPLAAVMNYMNAARRGLERWPIRPPSRARELLEKAVAQTGRAGQIIRRLRDFIEKKEPNRGPGGSQCLGRGGHCAGPRRCGRPQHRRSTPQLQPICRRCPSTGSRSSRSWSI